MTGDLLAHAGKNRVNHFERSITQKNERKQKLAKHERDDLIWCVDTWMKAYRKAALTSDKTARDMQRMQELRAKIMKL